MNQATWLASEDVRAMLRHVFDGPPSRPRLQGRPGAISDRKLRLFACACCRSVWDRLTDPRSRAAVEVAERFADGGATKTELDAAHLEAHKSPRDLNWIEVAARRCSWSSDIAGPDGTGTPNLVGLLRDTAEAGVPPAAQAAILRDLVGDPWRPATLPVHCRCGPRQYWPVAGECPRCGSEGWCPWLTPTVLALAQAAYEERPGRACGKCHGSGTYTVQVTNSGLSAANGYSSLTTYSEWRGCRHCGGDYDRKGTGRIDDGTLDNDRLLVLSDALEEAGATDADILGHLRGKYRNPKCEGELRGPVHEGPCWLDLRGPHYRGCWALDLILGKS